MMTAFESRIAGTTHIVAFLVEESFLVLTDRSMTQNALAKAEKMSRIVRGISPGHPRSEVEVGRHDSLSFIGQWKEVVPSVRGIGEQLAPFIESFLDLILPDTVECCTHRPEIPHITHLWIDR